MDKQHQNQQRKCKHFLEIIHHVADRRRNDVATAEEILEWRKKKQEMNTTADTNRETGGSSQARNHRRIRFSRMSPSVGRMSFLDRGS